MWAHTDWSFLITPNTKLVINQTKPVTAETLNATGHSLPVSGDEVLQL